MGMFSFLNPFGGSPNYSGAAIQNEGTRQAVINSGLDQINAVFGGGSAPFYSLQTRGYGGNVSKNELPTNQWTSQQFYTPNSQGQFVPYARPGEPKSHIGESFNPLNTLTPQGMIDSFINPFGLFGGPSPMVQQNQAITAGKLFTKTDKTFEGFQPEFYQQREKAYEDYALPQEAQQYQTNRNAILYGLSNRGLLDSSQAVKQKSDLERTAGQAKQSIADSALSQAQELQRSVEAARQNSIAMLYQTGDPAQGTATAINTAAGFRQPSAFSPIANLFSSLANQYYTNQLLKNSAAGGFVGNPNDNFSLAGSLGKISY